MIFRFYCAELCLVLVNTVKCHSDFLNIALLDHVEIVFLGTLHFYFAFFVHLFF